MELFLDNNNGAIFSDDRKYRYVLWRSWDTEKPRVMFIGLNPSTANENTGDPTIRRVIGFAKSWGYGGLYMLNLFAIVSADPKILLTCQNPIGENDTYLRVYAELSRDIVFAWGNFKEAELRARDIIQQFHSATCLGVNKNGSPKHPLYISAKAIQVNFNLIQQPIKP